MQIGTVKQIFRYAVKSMAGERLDECSVGLMGISGDRGWAIRDETTGEITNAKKLAVLMQCVARYREPPRLDFIPHVDMTFPDGSTVGKARAIGGKETVHGHPDALHVRT